MRKLKHVPPGAYDIGVAEGFGMVFLYVPDDGVEDVLVEGARKPEAPFK